MSDPSLRWALERLGLQPGESAAAARTRYRNLLRASHPDVASGISRTEATEATVELTRAFRIVRDSLAESGTGTIPAPPPPPAPTAEAPCRHRTAPLDDISVEVDGDTITITAPPPEAFALLLDAGARLGGIGYVDRALGLLEIIVRFEGGPSCSVLITLQGRAFGTDAFITMESIEADPTPSIQPVIDALQAELRRRGVD